MRYKRGEMKWDFFEGLRGTRSAESTASHMHCSNENALGTDGRVRKNKDGCG